MTSLLEHMSYFGSTPIIPIGLFLIYFLATQLFTSYFGPIQLLPSCSLPMHMSYFGSAPIIPLGLPPIYLPTPAILLSYSHPTLFYSRPTLLYSLPTLLFTSDSPIHFLLSYFLPGSSTSLRVGTYLSRAPEKRLNAGGGGGGGGGEGGRGRGSTEIGDTAMHLLY
eukprot:3935959-Rhodomonas_salina.1